VSDGAAQRRPHDAVSGSGSRPDSRRSPRSRTRRRRHDRVELASASAATTSPTPPLTDRRVPPSPRDRRCEAVKGEPREIRATRWCGHSGHSPPGPTSTPRWPSTPRSGTRRHVAASRLNRNRPRTTYGTKFLPHIKEAWRSPKEGKLAELQWQRKQEWRDEGAISASSAPPAWTRPASWATRRSRASSSPA